MLRLNPKTNCVFLILTLFLILPVPVWANVIFIQHINGKTTDFTLQRNGKFIEFSHYTRLQIGDKLCIREQNDDPYEGKYKDKEYSITLSINGSLKKLTQHGERCYKVETNNIASDDPNVFINTVNIVSSWFRSLWIREENKISAQIRGIEEPEGPLSMPLLKSNNTKLITEKNRLYLAWYGGKRPYIVEIHRNGERLVYQEVSRREVQVNLIFMREQPYREPRYQVTITDANSNTATGIFTVVTTLPSQFLDVQEAVRQSKYPKDRQDVILAAWLAQQGNGAWRFEAYQRVVWATEEANPSAFLIKQGLRTGY